MALLFNDIVLYKCKQLCSVLFHVGDLLSLQQTATTRDHSTEQRGQGREPRAGDAYVVQFQIHLWKEWAHAEISLLTDRLGRVKRSSRKMTYS